MNSLVRIQISGDRNNNSFLSQKIYFNNDTNANNNKNVSILAL